MIKKGIILAGGKGTRMSPLTKAVNKQLLPIYDKPLIFYPLSILMLAKIRDILIIVNKGQLNQYKKILPNGDNLGIKITYKEQSSPRGLPDAFILGEKFIDKDSVALILGDNFFEFNPLIDLDISKTNASIFLTKVSNPEEFGVVEVVEGEIISIQEKPSKPKSDYIAVGLYLFDNLCFEYIKSIQKSDRGEYEITSLIEKYLENNALNFQFTNGWWVDAGTPEAIQTIEKLI